MQICSKFVAAWNSGRVPARAFDLTEEFSSFELRDSGLFTQPGPDPDDHCAASIRQLSEVERSCSPRTRMAQFGPLAVVRVQFFLRCEVLLFDHLVGDGEQRRGHLKAEQPSGLQVDGEFELDRLLDRQVGGLLALEDFASIDAD
jgi:hypothetical protein